MAKHGLPVSELMDKAFITELVAGKIHKDRVLPVLVEHMENPKQCLDHRSASRAKTSYAHSLMGDRSLVLTKKCSMP